MTLTEIYREAARRGLRLETAGDKLAVYPKGKLAEFPDFADVLLVHKPALLAWLSNRPCPGWQSVPPSDLPLVTLRPNPGPQDRERVIAYLRRQTSDRPGPLCAWPVRRENAYYDGPGRTWDCAWFAYAAARDAACWQLNRSEAELHEFLTATEEIARGPNLREDA